MPDWKRLISERMGTLALSPETRQEVIAELATHLEDLYQNCRARGVNESQAIEIALSQTADWRELACEISDAKSQEGGMNDRSKQFWLPSLVTLTASMVWLMLLQGVSWNPKNSSFHGGPPLMPYLIWLATQPIFGACAAYLSRRAGGSCRARIAAGLSPSIAMLGVLAFALLTGIFIEKNPFIWKHPGYVAFGFLPWVIFPALALALGVLPFLKVATRRTLDP
jgi:post-segregation antitoxin (ccd killing protein)